MKNQPYRNLSRDSEKLRRKNNREKCGNIIREWRALLNISQAQAAELLGLHRQTIADTEIGMNQLKNFYTVRLAMAAIWHNIQPWHLENHKQKHDINPIIQNAYNGGAKPRVETIAGKKVLKTTTSRTYISNEARKKLKNMGIK